MKNDAGRIENDDDRSFHSHKDFFCDTPRIMQRQNELYVNKNNTNFSNVWVWIANIYLSPWIIAINHVMF